MIRILLYSQRSPSNDVALATLHIHLLVALFAKVLRISWTHTPFPKPSAHVTLMFGTYRNPPRAQFEYTDGFAYRTADDGKPCGRWSDTYVLKQHTSSVARRDQTR